MLLKNQKPQLLLLLPLLLFTTSPVHSQSKSEEASLYNWFDDIVGKENPEINNGTLYVNIYGPTNNNHNFYNTNEYIKGDLSYGGQDFYTINLKYDIVTDELILKRVGDYNYLDINLIKKKIESFTINNRTFLNLDNILKTAENKLGGFYEQNLIGNDFTFYIKHHKKFQKNLTTGSIVYEFSEDNSYYIEQKNIFYNIASKNDLITIFPKHKAYINNYYNQNNSLKKSNGDLFYENLIKNLNNLQTTEAK
jgi:hypothetical protein